PGHGTAPPRGGQSLPPLARRFARRAGRSGPRRIPAVPFLAPRHTPRLCPAEPARLGRSRLATSAGRNDPATQRPDRSDRFTGLLAIRGRRAVPIGPGIVPVTEPRGRGRPRRRPVTARPAAAGRRPRR